MNTPLAAFVTALSVGASAAIVLVLWLGATRAARRAGLPGERRTRLTLAVGAVLAAWLGLALWLGAAGVFHGDPTQPYPTIALGILLPIAIGYASFRSLPVVRDLLDATPPQHLVGVQLYRAAGAVFLLLYALGQVPGEFAIPAGAGDVLIGLTAPLLASRLAAEPERWWGPALLWNAIGVADLVVAVGTGFLTSPGPFHLLAREAPNTLVSAFPLVLIPTLLVPASILLHLASIRSLLRRQPAPRAA